MMGRPTKYSPAFNNQAYHFALLGATDQQLADFFEISESTLNKWKLEHVDFSESLKRGKLQADAEVAKSLHSRAVGYSHPDVDIRVINDKVVITPITKHYPPDVTAQIFWLKNRQPKVWRDKIQHTLEKLQDEDLDFVINEVANSLK